MISCSRFACHALAAVLQAIVGTGSGDCVVPLSRFPYVVTLAPFGGRWRREWGRGLVHGLASQRAATWELNWSDGKDNPTRQTNQGVLRHHPVVRKKPGLLISGRFVVHMRMTVWFPCYPLYGRRIVECNFSLAASGRHWNERPEKMLSADELPVSETERTSGTLYGRSGSQGCGSVIDKSGFGVHPVRLALF